VPGELFQSMAIPSEGIGSIPRPWALIEAYGAGSSDDILTKQNEALQETIETLLHLSEGNPITDGEQSKPSFVTYPIAGIKSLQPNGAIISFADGHTRQLPVITEGPFEYSNYAVEFFTRAKEIAPKGTKIKQAVIAPSAISLLYPTEGPIPGYSREEFISDIIRCGIKDIRQLLDAGADSVQLDFTEGRLALKLDHSGALLKQFLHINEQVLQAFSEEERQKIGIHSCPGADQDCTHSVEIEYGLLLPGLFSLSAGRFYLQMKSEHNPDEALELISKLLRPNQRVFIGVIDVNNPRVETPEEVCAFIERVTQFIPVQQLGTTDDCGFSPFADDKSTAREIAFAKIKARIAGTKLASERLVKQYVQ